MSVNLETTHPTREQALEIAKRAEEILKTRFGATRVIVFGSARGDAPWHEGSDLDLAVEGMPRENFWDAHDALMDVVPNVLDFDLVGIENAPPELARRILRDVKMPQDPMLALKSIVPDQLKSLEKIVGKAMTEYDTLSAYPRDVEMRGLASYVHDFYQATESIFERIAVLLDGELPKSADWHTELLMRMFKENPGIRPALLTEDSHYELLNDYRKFRHVFRMAYRLELEWDKLEPKIVNMNSTLEMLRTQLDQFFIALKEMKRHE